MSVPLQVAVRQAVTQAVRQAVIPMLAIEGGTAATQEKEKKTEEKEKEEGEEEEEGMLEAKRKIALRAVKRRTAAHLWPQPSLLLLEEYRAQRYDTKERPKRQERQKR